MMMESSRLWIDKSVCEQRTPIIAVDVSLLYQCIFRWIALHAGGPLRSLLNPSYGLRVACASGVRGCARLGICGIEGRFIQLSNDIDRDQQAQKVRAVGSASGCWNVTFRPLQAMGEILCGTIWRMISPLLTTFGVVDQSLERV